MKFVRFLLLCFLAVCLLCFTAILLLPRVNEKNIIRLPSKAISEYADFFAAKFSHAYGWVKAACELVHSLLISIVTVCSGIISRFATPSNPRSQKSKATVLVFATTISNAERRQRSITMNIFRQLYFSNGFVVCFSWRNYSSSGAIWLVMSLSWYPPVMYLGYIF